MARGRRHHGRSTSRNAGHVTRAGAITLASWSPGRGVWRKSHETKRAFDLWCEALKTERGNHGLPAMQRDGGIAVVRRGVYPCRFGDHHLIESAPRHWHIGRPGDRRT